MKLFNESNELIIPHLESNSIDSVVTDPPYGWSFMGKEWDYDVPDKSLWELVYRVLKPGGHMLVCCGTRTQHRMVVNIEDAGFEIRDIVIWIHGEGFPKSSNIGKMIDKAAGAERKVVGPNIRLGDKKEYTKNPESEFFHTNKAKDMGMITEPATEEAAQWDGWGTALKPAAELWTLCRKPISEQTVSKNVLEHGTGALNIDESRIGTNQDLRRKQANNKHTATPIASNDGYVSDDLVNKGRWPANVILGHHENCKQLGLKKVKSNGHWISPSNSGLYELGVKDDGHDKKMNEETVENYDCVDDCPVKILDEQTKDKMHGAGASRSGGKAQQNQDGGLFGVGQHEGNGMRFGDEGGASRFFYTAKARKTERYFWCNVCERVGDRAKDHLGHEKDLIYHPTQKPLALMEYLVKMITPPKGIVLDPYMGSGTTMVAAKMHSFDYVGIEEDKHYFKFAEWRIKNTSNTTLEEFFDE